MAGLGEFTFDASQFKAAMEKLGPEFETRRQRAEDAAAGELLRLSEKEVPHDTGRLQDSGHIGRDDDGAYVSYNTVYAARLHEHPEYDFQKGRKGKYLEDPLKANGDTLLRFMISQVGGDGLVL